MRPTKPTKRTAAEVIQAVQGSYGLKRIVCARLGLTRPTLDHYCRRWSSVREALKAEGEGLLDLAESTIIKANIGGCIKTSKWFLSLKGGSRGCVRLPAFPDHPEEPITAVCWIENGPGHEDERPPPF
jgi:hypothetical protein